MKKQVGKSEGFFLTHIEITLLAVFCLVLGGVVAMATPFIYNNYFTPAPYVKVISISGSTEVQDNLADTLSMEDFRASGIVYFGDLRTDFVVPGTLDDLDVAIVRKSQACNQAVRRTLADFVRNGGTMILFGDSCTTDLEDANINGWYGGADELGSIMPARLAATEDGGTSRVIMGKFRILATDHPIFNGVLNFAFNGAVTVVQSNNAEPLAVFGSSDIDGPNAEPTFAILEKKSGKGRIIYIASEGLTGLTWSGSESVGSRNMMLNMLLYAGTAGGHSPPSVSRSS